MEIKYDKQQCQQLDISKIRKRKKKDGIFKMLPLSADYQPTVIRRNILWMLMLICLEKTVM
jgi:hypothetical protein